MFETRSDTIHAGLEKQTSKMAAILEVCSKKNPEEMNQIKLKGKIRSGILVARPFGRRIAKVDRTSNIGCATLAQMESLPK